MQRILEAFLRLFGRVDRVFKGALQTALASVLLAMVTLMFVQVVLRGVFNSGISWADVVSRHMVLWIAFLGALLATRSRQHIGIDLISRLVSKRARTIMRFFLDIVSCAVCVFLARAAIRLVVEEHAMATELFLGIPLWTIQLIIPVGFILMAIEYAIGVMLDILRYFYNGIAADLVSERRPL